MKIIDQYIELLEPIDRQGILKKIELAGRTCYKSEEYITDDSAFKFVKMIIKSGHESVIEHATISVRIITDRSTTHEVVRHRIASYSQESSRYCCYQKEKFGNELTFIKPIFDERHDIDEEKYMAKWTECMKQIEQSYLSMSEDGVIAEYSRQLLPNSLKTEIVTTMNLRAWRNFLRLRTSLNAHPQIRDIANQILLVFKKELPEVFGDL